MILVLVWLALFGVWPFADPGHDNYRSLLVWIDLTVHVAASLALLDLLVERRARRLADKWAEGVEQ